MTDCQCAMARGHFSLWASLIGRTLALPARAGVNSWQRKPKPTGAAVN
ncbi:MAG: hypothetical protein HZC40_23305 [Chloroflexi bacterium]|nr:hypothetical protein [Chloroflexota bacterium]